MSYTHHHLAYFLDGRPVVAPEPEPVVIVEPPEEPDHTAPHETPSGATWWIEQCGTYAGRPAFVATPADYREDTAFAGPFVGPRAGLEARAFANAFAPDIAPAGPRYGDARDRLKVAWCDEQEWWRLERPAARLIYSLDEVRDHVRSICGRGDVSYVTVARVGREAEHVRFRVARECVGPVVVRTAGAMGAATLGGPGGLTAQTRDDLIELIVAAVLNGPEKF